MSTLTRFVLKHKLLVLVAWLALAVAGAMTATTTINRLTNSFAMPGAAFRTDARIQALYLHNGAQDPVVPVITLPAGITDPHARSRRPARSRLCRARVRSSQPRA